MKTPGDAAETIRTVMAEQGWTQHEFAVHSGVSPQTVNRWINGKVRVEDRSLARALAQAGQDPTRFGLQGAAVSAEPPWVARLEGKIDQLLAAQALANLRRLT